MHQNKVCVLLTMRIEWRQLLPMQSLAALLCTAFGTVHVATDTPVVLMNSAHELDSWAPGASVAAPVAMEAEVTKPEKLKSFFPVVVKKRGTGSKVQKKRKLKKLQKVLLTQTVSDSSLCTPQT